MYLTLLSIFGILLSSTCFILALIVYFYGKQKVHKIWALFNISVVIWGFAMFFIGNKTYNPDTIMFWWNFAHLGGLFIPVFFLHTMIEISGNKRTKLLALFYIQAAIFAFLGIINKLGYKLEYMFNSIYYINGSQSLIYILATLFWFAALFIGFIILLQSYFDSSAQKKNQLIYIFIGMFIGFIGGASHFLPAYGIRVYPFNITIVIYSLITTYAILKFNLLDVRVAFTRAGILLLVYVFILGFPFYFGFKTNHWVWSTIIMAVLASIGPLIYNFLRREAENILLSEQKQYQELLLQASRGMVREHDLNKLLELIVRLIKKSVKVSYAAAYIDDPENKRYVLKARRDGSEEIQTEFAYDHPFIEYLKTKEMPFTYEQMPENIKEALRQSAANTPAVKQSEIGLVVSSAIDESPLGFLVMGHKLNGRLFTEDDINVFKIISNNAAVAVHNCLFTEQEKKNHEKMLNAEKLTTIGAMATGVAHQFRNRLNIFSLAAGDIDLDTEDVQEPLKSAKEKGVDLSWYVENMRNYAKTIKRSVKRTTEIIEGVINLSQIEKEGIAEVDFHLSEFVDYCKATLKIKHRLLEDQNIPLKAEMGSDDMVYGDRIRLFESIYNSVDNAYEAIEYKRDWYLAGQEKAQYVPEIILKLAQKDRTSLISISDNGIGIKEEDKSKIFAPYWTSKVSSKETGSGIGMYFVKRNIEDFHKGRIWFESEYTKGTTFFIEIPRKPQ